MKTLVCYYSHTGNNAFLAKKAAEYLNADIEEIRPKFPAHGIQILLSSLNCGSRVHKTNNKVESYERVILFAPIWMGKFIAPLRGFMKRNSKNFNQLHYISCCGSDAKQKDSKFGHGRVFIKVEQFMSPKEVICKALPISMILKNEDKEKADIVMKARINDSSYTKHLKSATESYLSSV